MGAVFDIDIEAQNLGVDASTDELNALVSKIQQTNTVATQFDSALGAARKRLEEAAGAAAKAADALRAGEARYAELEKAANVAARAVEKAAASGKDTSALQTAATLAAEKMHAEAKAVDELRAKSVAAAGAQAKLTSTVKVLEGEAGRAASAMKKTTPAVDGTKKALEGIGANEKVEKIGKLAQAFGTLHGATALTAIAVVGMTAAAVAGVGALGAFAVSKNAAAMARLTAAADKAKKSFAAMFTGLKLDKFIAAVEDVMSIFDEGTSAANGLKLVIETILQPLFDGGAKLGPFIKEMFKGMVYGAMMVVVGILKLRNEIFKAMSPETRAGIKKFIADNFTLANAFKVGAGIAVALAAVFVILTAALAALAIAEIAAAWPILLIVAAVAAVIAAFIYWDKIIAKVSETWDAFVKGAKDVAKNIIKGIVDGIKNGVGMVVDALKGLASAGVDAFKGALGIKSPSRVFALQAHYTAQGYVQGIESSEPAVSSALESMVTPPDVALAGAGGQTTNTTNTSSAARVVQITGPITVGSRDDIPALEAMLLRLIEGAAITIGGAEAPAT